MASYESDELKASQSHRTGPEELLRKIVARIVKDCPAPQIQKPERGDFSFSIPLHDIDVDAAEVTVARRLLRKRFYANFIAELIIRQRVQMFRDAIAIFDGYESEVAIARHRDFGVVLESAAIVKFELHPSKLHEVINDEIENFLR